MAEKQTQSAPPEEWPKSYLSPWMKEPVMVIPADLGRELYEALKGARTHLDPSLRDGIRDVDDLLARYEREVGEPRTKVENLKENPDGTISIDDPDKPASWMEAEGPDRG